MAATDRTADASIAVVRRNTEEIQSQGNFALFDTLWSDTFVDHTPQPGVTADKAGVRILYTRLREAFPDFNAEIIWQTASATDSGLVTTFKIYRGTHSGEFLGVKATGKTVEFETVDVMRVVGGRIEEHWGVGNLLKCLVQIGRVSL